MSADYVRSASSWRNSRAIPKRGASTSQGWASTQDSRNSGSSLRLELGEDMTKAQLELLARMLINGDAKLVERNGKLYPVSLI